MLGIKIGLKFGPLATMAGFKPRRLLYLQAKCNLASSDVDGAMDCNMGHQRFVWDVTHTRCGISVDSVPIQ